jgi:hypothetical protein
MKLGRPSSGGIKKLLLAHIEKIVMAVIAMAAGWIIYSGLSVQGETRQPGELTTKVQTVSTELQNFEPDLTPPEPVEGEEELVVEEGVEPDILIAPPVEQAKVTTVSVKDYQSRGLDRAVVPPTVERSDPKLLVATKLEGSAVTALMPFYDAARAKQQLLKERKKELERERDQQRNAQLGAEENNGRGGGRGGPGRGGRGEMGMDGGEMEEGMRPVEAMLRPAGVPLDGTELIQAKSVAVVLAKVPVSDQYQAYVSALENARGYDPTRDSPEYLGAFIERADVTAGDEGELKWVPVSVPNPLGKPSPVMTAKTISYASSNWVQGFELPEDTRHDHPNLTFPLPPLVGRNWATSEVVHSDVPTAIESEKAANELEETPLEGPQAPAGEEDDLFGGAPDAMMGGERGMGPGGMGGRGMGPGGMGGRGMGPGGMGGRGMGGMMEGGMGGGRGGPMGGGGGGMIGEYTMQTDHIMLRFFDFGVQPGRKYQYRIKLVLNDVNRWAALNSLEKTVRERVSKYQDDVFKAMEAAQGPAGAGGMNRGEMGGAQMVGAKPLARMTEWSEPSPIISVPLAGDIRVKGVTPASDRQFNAEPVAELLVQGFDLDAENKAMQASKLGKFSRGSVMNLENQQVEILVENNRFLKEVDDFDFRTGVTLIDVAGGEKLGGELTAPARALLMDAAGRMYLRDELGDSSDIENYEQIYESKGTGGPGGGGERGMMPGGGRGGPGGGEFGF